MLPILSKLVLTRQIFHLIFRTAPPPSPHNSRHYLQPGPIHRRLGSGSRPPTPREGHFRADLGIYPSTDGRIIAVGNPTAVSCILYPFSLTMPEIDSSLHSIHCFYFFLALIKLSSSFKTISFNTRRIFNN